MLEALGKLYNVPVYETGVGFKYVAPKMLETNAMIGGEESGGYAFRGHVPERDGILANLYFLDFMVRTKLKPSQLLRKLFEKVGEHYYGRIDKVVEPQQKEEMLAKLQSTAPRQLAGIDVVQTITTDGFKFMLRDGSWVLIRFSGTEPLIRYYVEAKSMAQVELLLQTATRM
jgi:phosphomannomutase